VHLRGACRGKGLKSADELGLKDRIGVDAAWEENNGLEWEPDVTVVYTAERVKGTANASSRQASAAPSPPAEEGGEARAVSHRASSSRAQATHRRETIKKKKKRTRP